MTRPLYTSTYLKTRKWHVCCGCGRQIKPGTITYHVKGRDICGNWHDGYECLNCVPPGTKEPTQLKKD